MPETKIDIENTKAQMRKGTLEFCTLLIISKGEAYASDVLNELKAAELIVVEGTLYPLLSRLKTAGYLQYKWSESKVGPPRKYYTLTPAGKSALTELKATWNDFYYSINTLVHKYEKNN